MNENDKMIKRLSFENLIWISYIVISLLDIYGDELLKRNLKYNDKEASKKANKLFLGITLFTILIYGYFFIRNYNDYKKYQNKSYELRLIGSIFFLLGTFCLLYFQTTISNEIDSPSNV